MKSASRICGFPVPVRRTEATGHGSASAQLIGVHRTPYPVETDQSVHATDVDEELGRHNRVKSTVNGTAGTELRGMRLAIT